MRAASGDYTDGPRRWNHRDLGYECGTSTRKANGHCKGPMLVHNPETHPGHHGR
jgi:hypothetical protein